MVQIIGMKDEDIYRILNIIDESLDKEDSFLTPWFTRKHQKHTLHGMKIMVDRIHVNIFKLAQTTLTDELMAEMVTHLKDTGVWENTLLVVVIIVNYVDQSLHYGKMVYPHLLQVAIYQKEEKVKY